MRLGLRWKILLLTAPPLVALAVASLWMVDRSVSAHAHRDLVENLRRAAAVFEDMMAERGNQLAVAGAVIVRDPRFFSAVALPVAPDDPQFRATVAGVARDFATMTRSDLFEVTDARGRHIASVGNATSAGGACDALVRQALEGRTAQGVVGGPEGEFQVVVTPVVADRRIAGTLILGDQVGAALAARLRDLTRSEVTFLSGRSPAGTTLSRPEELAAALAAVPAAPGAGLASDVTESRTPTGTWLALAGDLGDDAAGVRHAYVLQRSLDLETAHVRDLRARLAEMGLLIAVAVSLAGLAIARHITNPVERLVQAAEAMERGQYDLPVAAATGDEIGELAERFDAMRQRQRAHVENLEEVARLRSEFIAVASHELRTPISVIQGYHQLLASGAMGDTNEKQREALAAIARSCAALHRIALDATRMAQVDMSGWKPELADADLAALVDQAIAAAREDAAGRRVAVAADVADDARAVRVDGPRLAEAIAHLVRNGIRFTPDGGHVLVRGRALGEGIEIEVADDGVGMSDATRLRLFDRARAVRDSLHHHSSSRLEFNSAGLGLGLAIAQAVVGGHGGTIQVESELGRGSTFTVRLPACRRIALEEAA
ncbi:MAG TPA: HAMP domain-containing sensor histidine kinase [Candidatus Eisenbacteria bacterium]|nr:HAMP domain-containing sensor histidine kinase [Candidatus Eisenbacteria bacterium]